jgi:hypothetical protein
MHPCHLQQTGISVGLHKWSNTYRVIHDFQALLQEQILWVFMIKKVNINMGPILGGYGVNGCVLSLLSSCELHFAISQCDLEPAGTGTVRRSCNLQLVLLTTEQKRALWLAVAFSKTCLKHMYV